MPRQERKQRIVRWRRSESGRFTLEFIAKVAAPLLSARDAGLSRENLHPFG